MTDPATTEQVPAARDGGTGQSSEPTAPESLRRAESGFAGLPQLIETGANEKHSPLVWRLISQVAAQQQKDNEALRASLAESKRECERLQQLERAQAIQIAEIGSEWKGVGRLRALQSLLYWGGGVCLSPLIPSLGKAALTDYERYLAVVGVVLVIAAFIAGRIGASGRRIAKEKA